MNNLKFRYRESDPTMVIVYVGMVLYGVLIGFGVGYWVH